MKIVNAVWERRNLGVNTYEVAVEQGDDIADILLTIDNLVDAAYVVIKAPVGSLEVNELLNKNGYFFAETIFNIGISLKDYKIPTRLTKQNQAINHKLVDEELLTVVCDKIEENIFFTDRIALDKSFGLKAANHRYSNWIKDEFYSGSSKIYELQLGSRGIGFFGLKEIKPHSVDLFLAGMYNEVKQFGLGFTMISKSIEEAISCRYKHLQTHVSSNNMEVLKLYISMGFNLMEIKNIFIKHSERFENE